MPETSPRRAAGAFDTSVPALRQSEDLTRVERFRPHDTPDRSARSSTSTPRSDPLLSPRRILGLQDSRTPQINPSPEPRKSSPRFGGFLLKQRKKRPEPAQDVHAASAQTRIDQPSAPSNPTPTKQVADSGNGSFDYPRSQSASLQSAKGKERLSSQEGRATSMTLFNNLGSEGIDGMYEEEEEPRRSTSIDAQQLVRMALSLSESRKMQLGPGSFRTAPPLPTTVLAPNNSLANDSALGNRGIKVQTHADTTPTRQPRGAHRNVSAQSVPPDDLQQPVTFSALSDHQFHITPASHLRAEKARAYIGLAHDYLRLLDCLPPLVPGISLSRRSEPSRGRNYNPLQYVRNRRVRNRERTPLDADAASWNDAEAVHDWVDRVIAESQKSNFVQGDIAMLPPWPGADVSKTQEKGNISDGMATQSPATSKPKRKQLDWNIPRQDLFADAYWLEQDAHKAMIESREGKKIFPKLNRALDALRDDANDSSTERPRPSLDAIRLRSHLKSDTDSPDTEVHGVEAKDRLPRRNRTQFLGRQRTNSTSSSDSSTYAREELRRQRPWTRHGDTVDNTAPLERHMSKLMKLNARGIDESPRHESTPLDASSASATATARRMGISEEQPRQHYGPGTSKVLSASPKPAKSGQKHGGSTRASREDVAVFSGDEGGRVHSPSRLKHALTFGRRKQRESFPRKSLSRNPDTIAEHGFGFVSADDVATKPTIDLDKVLLPQRETPERKVHAGQHGDTRNEDAPQKHLFKAGRISEAARKMMPLPSDRLLKDRKAWVDSVTPVRSRVTSDASQRTSRASLDQPLRANLEHQRSRSATDVNRRGRDAQFHLPNLPIFASSSSKENGDQPRRASQTRRQKSSKPRNSKARGSSKARGGIKSENVSPNTSTTDIALVLSGPDSESAKAPFDFGQRGGRLDEQAHRSGSGDARDVSPRKKSLVAAEGPWDALSRTRTASSSELPAKARHGLYPCAADVAYARALLESCGVKATAILARANSRRDSIPAFLIHAAQTTHQSIEPVAAKEEHVRAARMLSAHVESTVTAFEGAAKQFRSDTAARLSERIGDLRDVAGSRLTMRVRNGSDEADNFIAELTQNHTLAVKQVNDSVDDMMRSRRRRLRWLSRTAFSVLEWLLVGFMWSIWLLVFCVRIVRILVSVVFKTAKWLLFL